MGRLVAVVLAAGGSRRFGRSKQLLEWRGESLVRSAARAALGSGADETLVVLGPHAAQVEASLDGLAVRVIGNPGWEEGLGSSIRAGVSAALQGDEELAGLLLCLADQPLVGAAVLAELTRAWKAGHATVATGYPDGAGVPALFSRAADLEVLAGLRGDRGARDLLRGVEGTDIHVIPCAAALVDIDVEDDWRRLVDGVTRR